MTTDADTKMKLYFVSHDDDDGENYDLFVGAYNPDAVLRYWQEFSDYDKEGGHNNNKQPDRIVEVPTTPPAEPGALTWGDIKLVEDL